MNNITNQFTELDKIAQDWVEDGEKNGGEVKEVGAILTELLNIAKTADRLGLKPIAAVLIPIFVAIDMGREDVEYLCGLLEEGYLSMMADDELEDGETNLFNEDGSRVTLAELGIE